MKLRHIGFLTVMLIGSGMYLLPLNAQGHRHHHHGNAQAGHKEAHADHMLAGYAAVAEALYKDDLAAAKQAAAGMVKHDKKSAMAKPAKALSRAKTLEEARKEFLALSKAATEVAKTEKGWHVMHCPMAAGGKGATWLQKSADEVRNPYMGKKMPHCGSEVKGSSK